MSKKKVRKTASSNTTNVVIGVSNLVLGALLVSLSTIISLFVAPQLLKSYPQLVITNNSTVSLIVISIGIINIFLGYKLLVKSKGDKNTYIMYGVIAAIIGALFFIFNEVSLISTIYNIAFSY